MKGEYVGEVVSIHIVRQRNGAVEAVERATVETNFGFQRDWRSRRNRSGQITLIEAEVLEEVGRFLGSPVPSGASRRQIVVRGGRLNDLLGQRVRIGAVRVFVEPGSDRCDNVGDFAMLEVALRRIRRLWPDASLLVHTADAGSVRTLDPGVEILDRTGYRRSLLETRLGFGRVVRAVRSAAKVGLARRPRPE